MKWSYRLGQWFGIGVDVHVTFLLLLAWVAWSSYASSGSLWAVFGGVFFVLAIFLFVVMHEYGHALTARRFGIRTRRTLDRVGDPMRCNRRGGGPGRELADLVGRRLDAGHGNARHPLVEGVVVPELVLAAADAAVA